MPVWIISIGVAAGKLGISLIMSMLTEGLAKSWIAHSLERLAKRTQSSYDDQLVADLKKSWDIDQP